MDQQPKIPTLKDAQKPQVKIKGLGAGLTLFDRLKQFKKKDLAFILAGLGTLFMAPLAEHFMMAPETGSELKGGFGGSGGTGGNFFGNGSGPYENGNNGIAQGGAIGGAGDIITPLNVRDPSALVMGPGAAQQPPAGSAAPAAPPPTAPASSAEDYKDALKASASRAASAAVKKSPLPVPKVALGGSGLRGLGVAGGGTSASGSLGPINSGNLGQAGTGGGGLNLVRSTPGFRSAAGPRGPGNPQGLDGTKKAGQNAGDQFSRTGSALSGLNEAAKEQIPTGASGFGGGGQGGSGANDKAPGGSGPGGSKSVGESLAFIEAKERMMENLKLEFEKRKLKDPELLLYGIRNDSLKAMASEMTKSLTKGILGFMDPSSSPAAGSWECEGGYNLPLTTPTCDKDPFRNCMTKDGGRDVYMNVEGKKFACVKKNGKADAPAGKAETAPSSAGGVVAGMPTGEGAAAAAKLKEFCDLLDKEITEQGKVSGTNAIAAEKLKAAQALQKEVGKLVSKRDALYGTSTADSCKAEKLRTDKSVYEYQGSAVAGLLEEGGAGVPALIKAATDPKGKVDDAAIKAAREKYGKATELLQKVDNVTVDMAPFETKLFVDGGGTFQRLIANAKTAKTGIDKYAVDERELLEKKLNPLIQGAEFAGLKQGTPSVPEVVKVNSAYDAMAARAEKATGEKPGTGVAASEPAKTDPAAAKPDPKTEYDAVMATVETAGKAVGQSPAEGALAAVTKIEGEKKKDPKYEPTAEDKKPITDAWKAWADMQKKQVQVLSDVNGGLTDLKKGVTPPAATPTVAAAN